MWSTTQALGLLGADWNDAAWNQFALSNGAVPTGTRVGLFKINTPFKLPPIPALAQLLGKKHLVVAFQGALAEPANQLLQSAALRLAATFPAGTVSGAPKVRAMEIIDELEPVKRGVYAGAVGYLGYHGNMDVAIALRTGVVKDGMLHVQAGGGIVADSQRDAEWQETQNKAKALLRAAELAEGGLDTRLA